MYPLLEQEEKISTKNEWDKMRDKLENLDRTWATLPAMSLLDLPVQKIEEHPSNNHPVNLNSLIKDTPIPELDGARPDNLKEDELLVGQNIAVWTQSEDR